MEMESSRRSAPVDRSRELGWKKPRLAEEAERDCASNVLDRPLPAPRVSGGGRPTDPRIRPERDRERNEREDLGRGGSYQQQHLQELVAQYRTALAELTFNSKPIITNLTIIAGENLHAAKAIAATICANILEVPCEQKLPSLYLLDSIVKNIGRDYVKYFSARLPEVFCKAYKQVDSSIHPGMRHLFGTWKGVFSLAPLQMIEKELGFPPTANGSSGSTALKLDSQTQRPSHSIHVNPKYLEARQRLQQSTRAKEVSNDDINNMLSPASNDAERSDRSVTVGSARPWTDPMKMPNIQRPLREQLSDPEKKGYREYEFSTDLSGHSELGVGRVGERIKEPDRAAKPWYGASSAASEPPANRGNGFDVNLVYGNCREPGLVQANRQIPSVHLNGGNNSSRQVPTNWKNSEEEEYMWDDMNSRLTDCGGTSNTVKGGWNNGDADRAASFTRGKLLPMEHQDSRWTKLDTYSEPKNSRREDRVPFFMEVEENLTQPHQQGALNLDTFTDLVSTRRTEPGDHTSPVWPPHEPLTSVVALNHTSSAISAVSEGQPISFSSALSTSITTSLPVTGLLSHSIPSSLGSLTSAVSVLRGSLEQQVPQPLQPPSPSAQLPSSSASLLLPKSHISTNYDNLQSHSPSQMGQKPLQPVVQLNQRRHASVNQDSTPSFSHDQSQQSHSSLNSKQHKHLQNSPASSAPFNQLRHQLPFLRQSDPDLFEEQPLSQSQLSSQTPNPPLAHCVGSHQTGGIYGTGKSKNPAVDVLGQSNAGNLVVDILKSGVVPNNSTHNQNIHPPLPSGPPPIHALTSSVPLITLPSSLVSLPTSLGSVSSMPPPIRSVLPPLPPGPPPSSSILGTDLQVSNMSNSTPSPLSSLLSSLVAKGLITPSTELPSSTSAGRPTIPSGGSSDFCGSSAEVQVSSTSASLSTSPPSLVQELSLPNATTDVTLMESTCTAMKDLIGIDFRPDIVREFHPSVINSLVDDLKHQCNKCGMRFKFEQQLQSHLDWHATNNSREGSFGKMSRKWFVETGNWFARSVGATNGPLSSKHIEGVSPTGGKWEPMVLADESQCICALCGEPFEDFYSVESDRWMYKGTVYLKLPDKKDDTISMDRSEGLVPILHAKCISRSSGDLEVAENNEVDWKGS